MNWSKTGRRWTACISLLMAGFASLICVPIIITDGKVHVIHCLLLLVAPSGSCLLCLDKITCRVISRINVEVTSALYYGRLHPNFILENSNYMIPVFKLQESPLISSLFENEKKLAIQKG